MLMFIFAISCLTTSNLPWFMDLTLQVPVQYCSYSIRLYSITSCIHNWVLFLLWLHLVILSEAIFPLFSSSILGYYWPGEFIFQFHIFLPFHTVKLYDWILTMCTRLTRIFIFYSDYIKLCLTGLFWLALLVIIPFHVNCSLALTVCECVHYFKGDILSFW